MTVLVGCTSMGLPPPTAAPAARTVPAEAQPPRPDLVPVATGAGAGGLAKTSGTGSGRAAAALAFPPPPPIPILMYHVIGVLPAHAPLAGLYVAPDLFAAQMAALAAAGYQAITLDQAYAIWSGHAAAPPHPIVLSFDDGYVGVYEHAVPVLQAHGWPAVLNLQVGRLGIPGGLTADEVRAMIRLGWEVDDHTVTHPDLTRVTPARLETEIVGAAQSIRQQFAVPVHFFCYPAGRYDPAVVAAVRAAGFLGATTTWPGDAYPPTEGSFTLDRVRVDGGEPPERLLRVLTALGQVEPGQPPAVFPPPPAGTPTAPAPSGAAGGRSL